jgi:hypothetical protein
LLAHLLPWNNTANLSTRESKGYPVFALLEYMKVRPLVEDPLFCHFDVHTDHDLMTTRQKAREKTDLDKLHSNCELHIQGKIDNMLFKSSLVIGNLVPLQDRDWGLK